MIATKWLITPPKSSLVPTRLDVIGARRSARRASAWMRIICRGTGDCPSFVPDPPLAPAVAWAEASTRDDSVGMERSCRFGAGDLERVSEDASSCWMISDLDSRRRRLNSYFTPTGLLCQTDDVRGPSPGLPPFGKPCCLSSTAGTRRNSND